MATIGVTSATREPTNYLTLVQRTIQECQVPDVVELETVLDQEGQALDFCNWVAEAWREIQGKYPDWSWKHISPGVSFVTVAAQTIYTMDDIAITDVKSWDRETFRSYHTSTGVAAEQHMDYVPYRVWRDSYNFGSLRTSQVAPRIFSIRPSDQALCLQCPLVGYTITGDYFEAVTSFLNDEDAPSIPSEFIMAIVYRAMMFYGAAESAPDVYNSAELNFNKLMGRLATTRLNSEVEGPGALA